MSAEKVTKKSAAAPAATSADNLLLIKGIGPVNDRKLRQHGISSFAQIAAWKKADIVSVEKYLEFDGRIAREDWIGQARTLGRSVKAKAAAKPAAKPVETVAAPKVKAAAKPVAKPTMAAAKSAKTAAAPKPAASVKPAAKPVKAVAAPKAKAAAKSAAKPAAAPKAKIAAKPVAKPVVASVAPRAKAAGTSAKRARPAATPRVKAAASLKAAALPAAAAAPAASVSAAAATPILSSRGLMKRYGTVVALNGADFDLYPGEVLGVIGDNGAGKTSLIKALCGAVTPDHGDIWLDGNPVHFRSPQDARDAGIETVFQNLALSPALSIADNMFLGREWKKPGPLGKYFRLLDRQRMQKFARDKLTELGLMTIQNIDQPVETLSGGQRQGVAVARAAAFGSKVVIMDEPTAALGVKESRRVLELIRDVKRRGMPIILISHNMPHVFEVCDRIHIHRLGKRLCVIDPKQYTMSDAVAFMTGAKEPPKELLAA